MEVVNSIIFPIVRCAAGPIWSQLGYIVFYRSNFDNLDIQHRALEVAKRSLQQRVDDAAQNGEKIFPNVQNSLMKANIAIAEATDFEDNEGHARVGCLSGPFPNLWAMHQQSMEAKKRAKEISEILQQVNEAIKMHKISSRPRLPVAFPPSTRGYEALHSRTSILNEIMHELKEDNMYMIGVYGMGGVGKSSLIEEVAWKAERDGSFGVVIVATVTSSPDLKRIQGQLADGLGIKLTEESPEGRARRLWDTIKKENAILVIMDDIWKKIDLKEVGVPIGDHKGCKLLLTSRNLNLLNNEMGTQKNFKLETLSDEESWNLFEKTAGDVVKDICIQPTAFQVARACMGLPLLMVTVAKALKNQDLDAWEDAFKQLTKYGIEDLTSVTNEATELSYKYLASDQHKSLFLFIATYGQKNVFSEDLLMYGWVLGLFKNVETLGEARTRLYKLIDNLRASSLLLEGQRETVSMHDVIREGAAKIASRVQPFFCVQEGAELKEWPEMDQLKNCKHISLPWCYMPVLPEILDCPELVMLVLCSKDNFLKVPDHFFSGMRDLKILDLGGMMFTPSLPPSLCLLKNLRALCISKCLLDDITFVSKIKGLEILNLEGSEIQELPKEIGHLTHLRLLNLGNCKKLKLIPANLISSLRRLEELLMGNCYIQWELEGSEQGNNASLGELRHLHHLKLLHIQIHDISHMPRDLPIMRKLEKYKILIGGGWKWTWDYCGYSETSRILKLNLSSTAVTNLDREVKMLLNGVEDLSLAEVKGARNVLPEFHREGFEQLKHFLIQNSDEMLHIIDSTEWVHPQHSFLKLESLVIRNLINLEKICCGQLPVHIFSKLQVIKVKGCERLKNLFSFSVARNLPQLLEIEISECKFMIDVIVEKSQEESKDNTQIIFPKIHSIKLESLLNLVSFSSQQWKTDIQIGSSITKYRDNLSSPLALFDKKVAMPNLETMKLSSINTVKLWDDISAPSCIQNLTHLIVDSCGGLKYLFSSSVAITLVKLRYLEITNCQMLENIFVLGGELGNLQFTKKPLTCEEVKFPNLETLVVSHMDSLKSLYHDEVAPNPFPNLNKMEISYCQKLLSVLPSFVLNNLHNLETLVVSDCAVLEVLFETQELVNEAPSQGKVATRLKTLTLESLPVLKHIWSNDPYGSLQFQNLCTMSASNCQSLSHVFPLSVAMELLHLQALNIKNCGIESIVAKGEMLEEDPRFAFPQLTSVTFWLLGELKSFYPGIHTLYCPSLEQLDVYHCNKLEMFKSKSQNFQEVVPFHGQPLFSSAKVVPKIQELSLCYNDVTNILSGEYWDDDLYAVKALSLQCFHDELANFPMGFLQRFTNLESLTVACSSFTEIFSSENVETIMKLKTLTLDGLNELEHLCKGRSEIQPILENIETLEVKWCSRLTIVVPSSSSQLFQNLDKLWVGNCSGLVNIITSATARSFRNLRNFWIYNCEMVKEIVANDDDSDGDEVAFMKLELLQLENLPCLTSFCKENFSFKFPLLQTLCVIECPKMETFSHGILSAPKLRQVRLRADVVGDWLWEGELNTTIKKLFDEKVAMANLETMKLSSINTANLWDDISGIQNLIHLTIDSCGGLKYLFSVSVVIRLKKLRYLKITNCQMMEDIFVLDDELDNLQSTMKPLTCEGVKFPNLETLMVSHMDNLKSIYHDEVASNPFPKLSKMEISFCQKLSSLFPSYVLKNLSNLETLVVSDCTTLRVVFETQGLYNVSMELLQLQVLDIRRCGVECIVALGEMVEEDPRFVFPQLTSLTFWHLGELKSFYHGIHSLDCPSLKKLDVYHCNELEMFRSKSQNFQEVVPFHGQPLFSSVKAIPKIQELSLCYNDVTNILTGEYWDGDLYAVKALSLQCFHDELANFPMGFLQRFTNLESLTVACSSFTEIFSSENVETIMKLKTLTLSGLNELEHLCKGRSEIQPILENIETLEVKWCSRLTIVVPSSSSQLFQNLDKLWVGNCSGLVNIITSAAARNFPNLRNFWIYNCEMVKEIVANVDDSDGDEVAFMKLEHLQLENLPSLTSFCKENFSFKFPILQNLFVMKCPKMETFSHGMLSAPKLRKVRVTIDADGEWHWEGELNTTIRKRFDEEDPY